MEGQLTNHHTDTFSSTLQKASLGLKSYILTPSMDKGNIEAVAEKVLEVMKVTL